MRKYIEMYVIKKTAKISSIYEDNENTIQTKKKTERDLEKELEKIRNDVREIKKAVVNKNKDWLETNENAIESEKEKI